MRPYDWEQDGLGFDEPEWWTDPRLELHGPSAPIMTYSRFQEIIDANYSVEEQNALAERYKLLADLYGVED